MLGGELLRRDRGRSRSSLKEALGNMARARKHPNFKPFVAFALPTSLTSRTRASAFLFLSGSHMPRIHPRVFRAAHALHPHLAKLLPVCRDLRSAQNELRWLQEHAGGSILNRKATNPQESLSSLVYRRARGEPLQYILGTEFFGDLEIKCRPGVLIPR